MSQDLDPKCAQDMIQALMQFNQQVSEATTELRSAGNEGQENLGDDPAGAKANASLQQKVAKIDEQVSEAGRIASLLQEELEDAINRSRAADDF